MIDSHGVDKPRWTTHIGNGNTNKYIITYYITASDGRSASVFPPQPTFHVADLTLTVRPLLVRVHFIRRKKLRSVFGSLDFLEPEITEAGITEPQLQKGGSCFLHAVSMVTTSIYYCLYFKSSYFSVGQLPICIQETPGCKSGCCNATSRYKCTYHQCAVSPNPSSTEPRVGSN